VESKPLSFPLCNPVISSCKSGREHRVPGPTFFTVAMGHAQQSPVRIPLRNLTTPPCLPHRGCWRTLPMGPARRYLPPPVHCSSSRWPRLPPFGSSPFILSALSSPRPTGIFNPGEPSSTCDKGPVQGRLVVLPNPPSRVEVGIFPPCFKPGFPSVCLWAGHWCVRFLSFPPFMVLLLPRCALLILPPSIFLRFVVELSNWGFKADRK